MNSRVKFVVLSTLMGVCSSAFAKGEKPSQVVPYADIKWEEYAPGTPLMVAKLWGDPSKGAHGRFLKLPGGFEAGVHSHSGDYNAVLISGTWMHWDSDKATGVELSPGSYVMQPGKANHNDKCKEGADCVLLIVQATKADYIPEKAPAKK